MLDPAMFVAASSSPLQPPASSLPSVLETLSPSPLPLSDLLPHTTLLKASEGQDGWGTSVQEQHVCILVLPAGQASPKRRAP